tara:strand:+ start:83 stop:547 length:465 start_codon:yes stop_codon:yes gene_type:complete
MIKSEVTKNSRGYVWVIMILSIPLLLGGIWAISISIAQNFFFKYGEGEVITVKPQHDGSYRLNYMYYNEFNNVRYSMYVHVRKNSYSKVKEVNTVKVKYSKYFPKQAIAVDFENSIPLLFLLVIFSVIPIIIYRSIRAINRKLSGQIFFWSKDS